MSEVEEFWKLYERLQKMFGLQYMIKHTCDESVMKVYFAGQDVLNVRIEADHHLDIRDPLDASEAEDLQKRAYERAQKNLRAWAEKKFEELNINYKL